MIYCIFDPTGNITALVESKVPVADQPAAAAEVMKAEPDVEQVGFVTYADENVAAEGRPPVSLRMAGGEFCGNAAMSAAALFAIRSGLQEGTVQVEVSGASTPIEVSLEWQAAAEYSAAVRMPPALGIGTLAFTADGKPLTETAGTAAGGALIGLPLVEMEGISHIIVEPDSGFFGLKDDSALAESLLREWCSAIRADCLGLVFLDEGAVSAPAAAQPAACERATPEPGAAGRPETTARRFAKACERALTPLVYVPGADTMFWENSCASGSAAAGIYLAAKAGAPVDATFNEPAGSLRVESDPASGTTILHGTVKLRDASLFH